MNIHEKINFRMSRDVGQVYNTAFKYMRQNQGVLFKSITYYAMPFILAGGFVFFNGMSDFITVLSNGVEGNWIVFGLAFLQFFFGVILIWVAYTMYITSIFGHMKLYHESEDPRTITHQHVWKAVRQHFFMTLLNVLLRVFIILILFFAVLFIYSILNFIFTIASITLGPTILGVVMVLVFFIFLFGCFYVQMITAPMLFMTVFNKVDIFTSFARCFSIINRSYNFWNALGAFFLVFIILTVLHANLVSLPIGIIVGFFQFNGIDAEGLFEPGGFWFSVLFRVVFPLFTLLYFYTLSIYFITQAFEIMSLDERVNGKGLAEKINKLGTTKDVGPEYYDMMY